MPSPAGSLVLEFPPPPPAVAADHLRETLSRTTDPSDVHADLERGETGFVVLDARSPEAFARGHVPGAINLPHRKIDAETTATLRKDVPIVAYCDGAHCNASTKAAMKLAELGFLVKEMIGGMDGWIRDGWDVEMGGAETAAAAAGNAAGEAARNALCGC
ncbi:MAG TPA: rhodanese-like domain-containing protein [Thermoanaerobaculia bacterium]|nr:rhodanese-like domain-containing protein [Thermoanaerobaculia bacterium]